EPSAVELRWRDRTGRIDVLFEGTAAGVDAQLARARVDLDRAGPFKVADGPDATDAPGAPPAAAGHVLVKVTHPPASLPGVLHELREVQDRHGLPVAASGHAATGVTFVAAPWSQDASDDGLRRSIEDLRGWAFASGGSA